MNFQKELKNAGKWLIGTLCFLWLLTIFYFWQNRMSPIQTIQLLPEMTWGVLDLWQFWIALLLPYVLFVWTRFLIRSYQQKGKVIFFKRLLLTTFLPLILLCSSSKLLEWYHIETDWRIELAARNNQVFNHFKNDGKIRGVHFQPARMPADSHFIHLVRNNVEWINLSTYAWQISSDSDYIKMPPLNEFGWSKKDSSNFRVASFARKYGIKTILSPQILLENNKNTTSQDIKFEKDTHWKNWSKNYKEWIFQQAKVAEQSQVEALSIGSELSQFTVAYPDFFEQLIDSIRIIYKGRLTYAADWEEEFLNITFWNKLDWIGIEAGFPLVNKKNPSLDDLKKGWEPHFEKVKKLQSQINIPVIFTKIGYRSNETAAIDPLSNKAGFFENFKLASSENQYKCYQAFFETFWEEEWFAGAIFYDWKANYSRVGGERSVGFSPQNKRRSLFWKNGILKATVKVSRMLRVKFVHTFKTAIIRNLNSIK